MEKQFDSTYEFSDSLFSQVREVFQCISQVKVEMAHIRKPKPGSWWPVLWSLVGEQDGVCEHDVADDTDGDGDTNIRDCHIR